MSIRSEQVKRARKANPGMRRVERQRRAERIRARLKAMLGDQCARCGATEELEFDHIDPDMKSFSIAARIRDTRFELLEAEARKCQLLCKQCHRDKTAGEQARVSLLPEVRFLKQIGLSVAEIAQRLGIEVAAVRCLLRHERVA
jgi:5-methylcytosine-specific restriction endonuclease McrA